MSISYFEDAVVGYVTKAHRHEVTEEEIIEFAKTWDPMPFHIDPKVANDSHFGGITASGAHIYAIFVRLAHKQPDKMAVLAALGVRDMRFVNPVRPSDILYLEGKCIDARESKSKSDRGISTFVFRLINQDNNVVLELTQPLMLAKKSSNMPVFSKA